MKEEKKLPAEIIKGYIEFAEILRKIHNRLISEGYVIKDETLIDQEGSIIYPVAEENEKLNKKFTIIRFI